MVGWPAFAAARPNDGHRALARLASAGRLHTTVTQNVDGLHAQAGQRDVIELHGRLADVRCLDCGREYPRVQIQEALLETNPTFAARRGVPLADGDVELESDDLEGFRVPLCPACGGTLKPAVVFFGESVPRPTVERALRALDASSAVLVVGSSLMVYSGYRFCRAAHASGKPIVAINRGVTRADPLLEFKVGEDCVGVLRRLVDAADLCSV